MITAPQTFEKMVEIRVSIQAQKILAHAGKPVDEFVEWAIKKTPYSLGGNDVSLFLEQTYEE